MIPVDKVREIISKHKLLEEELSSDKIDKKKFAKISFYLDNFRKFYQYNLKTWTFLFFCF